MKEQIRNGVTIQEAANLIAQQGGVVYAPHPYAYLTRSAWRAERAFAVADVIEVFNSRAFRRSWNRRAAERAARDSLLYAAGSDAHMPWEIGRARIELTRFDDAPSLLRALANPGPIAGRTCSLAVHGLSASLQGFRTALGRGHGVPLRRSVTAKRKSRRAA
jgi:predicted metal-dependent phosphoesterase TrpH